MINYEDTIAAIATPPGRGAIGIIRVSGNYAIELVDKIFYPYGKKKLREKKTHTLTFGKIKDKNGVVDEVLAAVMRAPKSFTGENSVEIYCHGGNVVLENVMQTVINAGARLATPGEFTRRAFINGKIDLTQAEAIGEVINAPTELARRAAVAHLEGIFSNALEIIKTELINIISELEANIEFPDDVQIEKNEQLLLNVINIKKECNKLLENADNGKILHDGYRVAIAGKPNAGKSSILNKLAKEERALVTEIPGTTRDYLEADLNIEGFPVRFIDTAGLRNAKGKIEQHGIKRAEQIIKTSDMIIWVADVSKLTKEKSIDNLLPDIVRKKNNILIILNKIDLIKKTKLSIFNKIKEKYPVIKLSAKTGEGIEQLHKLIADKLNKHKFIPEDDVILLKVRHVELLKKTVKCLCNATNMLKNNGLTELIVVDLRDALNAIAEITGEFTTEDLLDKIFSDFCIGK